MRRTFVACLCFAVLFWSMRLNGRQKAEPVKAEGLRSALSQLVHAPNDPFRKGNTRAGGGWGSASTARTPLCTGNLRAYSNISLWNCISSRTSDVLSLKKGFTSTTAYCESAPETILLTGPENPLSIEHT